jgi:curved DNA-binding protein CbpA
LEGDDLEDIFWPFLDPRIQHAVEHFRNRGKRSPQAQPPKDAPIQTELPIHSFDKRRLHYLKFGRMEQGYLWLIPEKVFNILRYKSRDEIEQQFMVMERQLNPREYKAYAYVAFDVNRFFTESFAAQKPQFLKQSDIDEFFVAEICKLNGDSAFWAGMTTDRWLHDYLIRYVLMFFDYDFAPRSWVEDYIRNFVNSRRGHQFPSQPGSVTMKEASSIFGQTKDALKKMSRQELSRFFRRRARELHPDKGGDQEKFVELTRAYDALLRTKKD